MPTIWWLPIRRAEKKSHNDQLKMRSSSSTSVSTFFKVLRPFLSLRFWKLNVKTIQMKLSYAGRPPRPYTEYLQQYYRRDLNPYYERIEDKWKGIRLAVFEMAELKPGECILDVGTGLGFQAAATAGRKHPTTGIDYVFDRLQLARQRHGNAGLQWIVADAGKLPFAENGFDVITISLALHDMPVDMIKVVLREVHRVARRRAVIAEPRLPDLWLIRQIYRSIAILFDESVFIKDFLAADIELFLDRASLRLTERRHFLYNTLAIYVCDVVD
jgi:SAM-dependent methyltransferase